MERTPAVRNIPEAIATSSVPILVSSGKGKSWDNTRPYIKKVVPAGSRKTRKLGIRLETRWLSIIFTAAKIAALSIAV